MYNFWPRCSTPFCSMKLTYHWCMLDGLCCLRSRLPLPPSPLFHDDAPTRLPYANMVYNDNSSTTTSGRYFFGPPSTSRKGLSNKAFNRTFSWTFNRTKHLLSLRNAPLGHLALHVRDCRCTQYWHKLALLVCHRGREVREVAEVYFIKNIGCGACISDTSVSLSERRCCILVGN